MSSGEQEALRLADVLEPRIRMAFNANAQCAAELRRLVADVEHKDAYAEQLGRELAKATAEREADRAAMREALEALEVGHEAANDIALELRMKYAGYMNRQQQAADNDVRKIAAAISLLKERIE